ncbi:glycosyltransferase family 2 protein [Urbifossiella limnaea]|uniref:Beta-monoglucosyldiacylglycerol synthase n=1 Tax=Urbifossiella limnaea TaxID=2528023 RepID=A0A517Y3B0_9BACT|nr:glycosyltransferase family 2 protein [Urbifossiella limnaea]QDU24164.1 Beta-monoglucosyldiacylglycerol synthase [Urbifossiella limnaea]
MNSPVTEVVCWTALAAVSFAYLGYPVLIWTLSRVFGRSPVPPAVSDDDLPTVSLLVAAYNEEVDIEARVLNALSLDYPRGKLEIVIATDGCTDRTNELVRPYTQFGVRLVEFSENAGKASVLNRVVPQLTGEVVVLSDANTHMATDAVRRLAAWFRDPAVGVACGKLVLTDPKTGQNADGLYWKYETFLKKCESRLGALLGANGAIYAVRRSVFPAVRPGTMIDDFVIPLDARRRSGCRLVYDARAAACEETAPTIGAEFGRRARIGAGGFQSIGMLWPLLSPRHGWVALTFLCHKILRWVCPFFMIAALVANLLLVGNPLYAGLLVAQVGFYALAAAGHLLPGGPRWVRYLRLPTMFVTMNAALLVGFFRWLTRPQTGTWRRTDRTAPALAADPSGSLQERPVGSGS